MQERGLLTMTDSDWAKANHRAEVIGPLASLSAVTRKAAEEAALQLGLSLRQVRELIKRFRAGDGLVTDIAPGRSGGGKGKPRIKPEVDAIISEVLETMYLTRQKRSEGAIIREVGKRCRQADHQMPAGNTIRARIRSLDPIVVAQSREGFDATRALRPAAGKAAEPGGPLDIVQMDHTPVDVIVVEETSREPIGRPYLTLSIDTFTRCIVGLLLTFEAPSATSVGLCLAHTVMDKSAWLTSLGIVDMTWIMHGKPNLIYLDNAPEFHSDALKRGCEQHGIKRGYRPGHQPHFGGIIERVIGTAMRMAHELPGTTFSNTQDRGNYNSEGRAVLTLRELEKWLTLAIGIYHETVHRGLWESPAACWKRSTDSSKLFTVKSERAFLIDFLPVIQRSIGRTGFLVDHISYYADILKPWIANRHSLDRFVIRRDPRDISKVWVLDPESKHYLEIPYRSLANPAVTLWEHKKALAKLREKGRAQLNEAAIFRMIDSMREITETAAKERKRARLDKARRVHLEGSPKKPKLTAPDCAEPATQQAKPFEDIELW